MMPNQYQNIRSYTLMITLIVILGGLIIPKIWIENNLAAFAIALILGGVPHGASDYLIYRQLTRNSDQQDKKWVFGIYYLSTIIAYGTLWWFNPAIAFALFILISLYHFGQSNWEYVKFSVKTWEMATYILWGSLVVGFPVLLYHEESSLIIFEITGQVLEPGKYRWPILFILFALNVFNIVQLSESGLINGKQFKKEIINILVLTALFMTTPLLIGFGIYFVFWHSSSSIIDQISILRQLNQHYNLRQYLIKLLPLSLLAFVGLALLYWFMGDRLNQELNFGILFLFISIITVPHTLLIDRFYKLQTTK